MSPYWWLAIAALMAVIELASQGFITVWFVAGAVVAFVVGILGVSLGVQIVVFLAVSLVCLALLRPLIMKHRAIGQRNEPTLVGTQALVVEEIDANAQTGRVETPDHMTWAALSSDGSVIGAGAQVRVVEQRSIKLIVERM